MNTDNLWLGLVLWIIILGTIKGLSLLDDYLNNRKYNGRRI
jgi:hypothetical protein